MVLGFRDDLFKVVGRLKTVFTSETIYPASARSRDNSNARKARRGSAWYRPPPPACRRA